jgi:hypothetical protein
LAKNPITKIDHPPYSPAMFGSFQNLKIALKGQKFADLSDIQRNMKMLQRGILENDFQDCFQQWHHHLTKCIGSQAEYFKGNSSC